MLMLYTLSMTVALNKGAGRILTANRCFSEKASLFRTPIGARRAATRAVRDRKIDIWRADQYVTVIIGQQEVSIL